MGLDIHIGVDNPDAVYDSDYYNVEPENQYALSRTFCNMMCRRDVIVGEPELNQVGEIAKADIAPFYELNDYLDEDSIDWLLSSAETVSEREERVRQVEADRAKLAGNINKISELVDKLIMSLSAIDNLPNLLMLDPADYDTLDAPFYFANFNSNPGDGYIGNNLGQDLRNFRRFLAYAKSKGTQTIYFNYG